LQEYLAGSNPTDANSIPSDINGNYLPDTWETNARSWISRELIHDDGIGCQRDVAKKEAAKNEGQQINFEGSSGEIFFH
jgi:hypothetical protein